MTTVDQFLSTTQIDGALTPEQAAQVLDLAQEGETAPVADLAGAPAPAPAEPVAADESTTTDKTTTEPEPDTKPEPEPEPEEEPAILAKDGKHLIAYEKLAEARDSAKRAAAERDEALRRAAELQAQLDAAKEPAKEPETRATVADLRRERYNALLDGDLDKAIQLDEKIEAEVQAQRQQVNDAAAAFAKVAQEAMVKYPALDLSNEKADKDAIDYVVLKRDALIVQGTPAHEALAQAVTLAAKVFRWSDGQAAPAPAPTPDPKAAAAAAAAVIAQAKAPVPASLSAIPGGKPGGLSTLEQLAGKASGPEMLQVMENMTPEQIESFLNRSL